MVIGPVVPTCAYTTELAATGMNCRVAAGRDTALDMLRDEEYCIETGALQSKLNCEVPEPAARVNASPTRSTPPPQASLYQ